MTEVSHGICIIFVIVYYVRKVKALLRKIIVISLTVQIAKQMLN